MGIETLEEKFQLYKRDYPQKLLELTSLARQISRIQLKIRDLLSDILPDLCPGCKTKCCSGMPIDGWFTPEDYFAYRMLYEVPHNFKVASADLLNCSFLKQNGCSLPEAMRPLACVKVNCENLNAILKDKGTIKVFKNYCEELDDVQVKLWKIIDGQDEQ